MSEEELKHYVDQYFEKYWSVSFDKYLENMEEGNEIKDWALKEVKRLKNKNEELKDQLEFARLNNPEMNFRYFKLVNSNRRKINCLREENKRLKEELRQKENIIKELREKIELTTINCEGAAEDLIDDIYSVIGLEE